MKFVPVNENLTAREQGYVIDTSVKLTIDRNVSERFRSTRNDPFGDALSDLIDGFYDFDTSPVYRGEDGKLYAVEMVYFHDMNPHFQPLCWQPIIKKS